MGTIVRGTGSALPERNMSNVELESLVETNDEWIRTRTGIENRRIGGDGEKTYQLAATAARRALEMAEVDPREIDLLVVGTISSHMLMPSTACYVQNEIGANRAFAYDISAACCGFLYGLDIADKHIRADRDANVLIIGAETLSSRVNWEDRNTCILFGDGAGAAVLAHTDDDQRRIIGTNHRSDGGLWDLLYMHQAPSLNPDLRVADNPGVHIVMEGREVFKHAVKAMEDAIDRLFAETGKTIDDVDVMIPHQANIRILNKLVERIGVDRDKVVLNVMNYGNTSAASIPIALDETNRSGRIKAGDTVLFCSFGGGLTWGATLLTW